MAKKFKFDEAGNLTVTEETQGKDANGNVVTMTTQHDIQASQVERHYPMFSASMSNAEKAEAAAIIAEQQGE